MSVQPGNGKHTLPRVIFRFLSGRDLDGGISRGRRTNATFLRRAHGPNAVLVTGHDRLSPWAHAPGWHRSAWRIAGLLAVCGAAYGAYADLAALTLGAELAGAITLIAGIWRAHRGITQWSHVRNIVRPLWITLAPIVGHPAGDDFRQYLDIPKDYAKHEKLIIPLKLPPTWEGIESEKKRVLGLMSRRLNMELDARWHHHKHLAEFYPAPQPPRIVMFDDYRAVMEASPENVLSLGYGTGKEAQGINLDSDAPHVLISAGTGGAKSDTTALIIAGLVRKKCERIDMIDPKRISHMWAAGLPGLHIHKYVADQMEAIKNARILMDSRYDQLDAAGYMARLEFPRHVLIIEEQNSFMQELQTYWEDHLKELSPDERRKAGRKNPAIADLMYILAKGRACRINVISIFQRASASAVGSGDMRENYGAKILARYSPQTWKILVGTSPVPRSSRIPGRAMLVIGDEHKAIQRAYAGISDKDGIADPAAIGRLRAWALNGRPDLAASPDAEPEPVPLLTLREATETGVIPLRYSAARKARLRDPDFPAGQESPAGLLYVPDVLRTWHAERPAGRRSRLARAA